MTHNTNIITHTFNTFPLRVIQMEGQPWFVAKDVLEALGLTAYTSAHYNKLAANELANISRITLGLKPGKPMTLVSESGLYKLIMRSDKPQAHAFQNWVTREVLPAIRKDGAYIMGEEKVVTGEMTEDELVMKAMNIMSQKLERLKAEKERLAAENAVMLPKAEGYDTFLGREGLTNIKNSAVLLGFSSAQKLNNLLRELGWKSKDKKCHTPTKLAAENGWLAVRTFVRTNSPDSRTQTLITNKGLDALRQMVPKA